MISHIALALSCIVTITTLKTHPSGVNYHLGLDQVIQLFKGVSRQDSLRKDFMIISICINIKIKRRIIRIWHNIFKRVGI